MPLSSRSTLFLTALILGTIYGPTCFAETFTCEMSRDPLDFPQGMAAAYEGQSGFCRDTHGRPYSWRYRGIGFGYSAGSEPFEIVCSGDDFDRRRAFFGVKTGAGLFGGGDIGAAVGKGGCGFKGSRKLGFSLSAGFLQIRPVIFHSVESTAPDRRASQRIAPPAKSAQSAATGTTSLAAPGDGIAGSGL